MPGPVLPPAAARVLCALIALAAACALAGVVLAIPPMAGLWPGQPSIKANTALGFLLASGTLLVGLSWPRAGATAARVGGVALIALGSLTLLEHLTGWHLGLDQWLVRDREPIIAGAAAGRMAPLSAVTFVLVGAALFAGRSTRRPGLALSLAGLAAALALLTLIAHLQGAYFHGLGRHAIMRVPVTILFLLLSAALVIARPDAAPMQLLGSASAGGLMARRLLPVAVAVPILFGALASLGEEAGLYDADFGSALIVAASVLTLVTSVAAIAWRLHRTDEQRLEIRARELGAQRAVEERDQFLMVAAHELYSPISSLLLMVEALERQITDAPDQCLAIIGRQTRRLTGLVGELLDVSRVGRGEIALKLEKVNLVAVTSGVLEAFAPRISREGSVVSFQAPTGRDAPASVVGWWDRMRLEQVLENLLSNAIKFGAGNPIDVCVDGDGLHARITVRDRGVGIPPDRADRIFDRFERAMSVNNYGGLGVGLYIVRGIVQSMGGTVEAESTIGRGATFTVTLPCAGPPRTRGATPSPTPTIQA